MRCPYCGYENPVTPAWLTRLRGWLTDSAPLPVEPVGSGGVDGDTNAGTVEEASCR